MKKPPSIARTLTRNLFMVFAVFWLTAVGLTTLLLNGEQSEFRDTGLQDYASLLLPVIEDAANLNPDLTVWQAPFGWEEGEEDDLFVFQLRNAGGQVLLQSRYAPASSFSAANTEPGFAISEEHRLFTSRPNDTGNYLIVGEALLQRSGATFESMQNWIALFLLALPIGFFLVRSSITRAIRPLNELGTEIEQRDSGRLDHFVNSSGVSELETITDSLNSFMHRLKLALDSERAFSANCAHELRTPVAVALAQVQRISVSSKDTVTITKAHEVASALKRLTSLIERLLQLARADAGIGFRAEPVDVMKTLRFMIKEWNRGAQGKPRLVLQSAPDKLIAPIDTDAFGIVLANLFDNALKFSPEGSSVNIRVIDREIRISNEGPLYTASELAMLKKRFEKGSAENSSGLGLGFAIVETIVKQAKGEFDIYSPQDGKNNGFECRITLPR